MPASSARLSRWRILLFGLASLPFQLSQNVIGFHLNLFLLNVSLLSPALASLVVSCGRLADAVTDPLVGFLVSRTRTRFGRCRPWLLAAGPAGAAVFFLLWLRGVWQWHLLGFVLFSLAITCYHVPYTSLTVRLSHLPRDRDAATACRMTLELLGVLIGPMIFALIIEPVRARTSGESCALGLSPLAVGNFSGAVDVGGNASDNGGSSRKFNEDVASAYLSAASIVSPIYLISGLIGFFGTREVPDSEEESRRESLAEFFRQFARILVFKPYLMAMCTYLTLTLVWQLFQAIAIQFIGISLQLASHVQFATAAYLLTALAVTPGWYAASARFGKRRCIMVGTAATLACCLLLCGCPAQQPLLLYALSMAAGVCGSNAMLLTWSMVPDVIELWRSQGGQRQESVFYSTFTFFNKCVNSLAMILLNAALGASGYDGAACQQSAKVATALRLLLGGVSPLLLLTLLCEWRLPFGGPPANEGEGEGKGDGESEATAMTDAKGEAARC